MRTGPQKGSKTEAPGGHRSPNQPVTAPVVQRGKAVSPTQGRTRNHPSVAPVPKTNIGGATAHRTLAIRARPCIRSSRSSTQSTTFRPQI